MGVLGAAAMVTVAAAAPAWADGGVQANPQNWGLDRVDQRKGVDQTYHYETTADNVTVYVIDTGIDAKQPDFGGRVEPGKDFLDGADAGAETPDLNGHGTNLAGVVGGKDYGVAKGVHLFPVRVLDKDGGGSIDAILAGIDWVTKNATQPAVALLGIGGAPNDKLDTAVRGLAAVMPVVVPAGGDQADASKFSPSRVSEALTVGASDELDRMQQGSNFGPAVDLYAPGVQIPAPAAGGAGGAGASVLTGTSIAAAHVAGAAALYRALHPDASPADVCKGIVDAATRDALTGLPQGTPNRLLYTLTPTDAAPPPAPAPSPTPPPSPSPPPSE